MDATMATSSGSSSSSSSASSEAGDSGPDSSDLDGGACGCALPSASVQTVVYEGGDAAAGCSSQFEFDDVVNYWFYYDDGTSSNIMQRTTFPGCGGAGSCASYASGSGFTGYGAGFGLSLNYKPAYDDTAIFDASGFTGVNVWLEGTTSGTRGPGFSPSNNTVHVKLATANPDGGSGDPRLGDDYGTFCPVVGVSEAGTCFTLCSVAFANVTREGLLTVDAGVPDPATDQFDPQNLVSIQFEASPYSSSTVTPNVAFSLGLGQVTFYK